MVWNNRTKQGAIIAAAVLSGLTSFWLTVLFLAIAAFLIAWGQASKRTEDFISGLPGGDQLLKALAQLDPDIPPQER